MDLLLSYDLNAIMRKMIPIFLINLFSLAFFGILFYLKVKGWIFVASIYLLILSIIALILLPNIIIGYHYYQSFYGNSSSFHYTLPYRTADLFNSKIIAGLTWTLSSILFLLFLGLGIVTILSFFGNHFYQDSFSYAWNDLREFLLAQNFGPGHWIGFFVGINMFILMFSVLSIISWYFIISLGVQIFPARLSLLGIIIVCLLFSIILSVLQVILNYVFPYVITLELLNGIHVHLTTVMPDFIISKVSDNNGLTIYLMPVTSVILWLGLAPIYYFLTLWLLKHNQTSPRD